MKQYILSTLCVIFLCLSCSNAPRTDIEALPHMVHKVYYKGNDEGDMKGYGDEALNSFYRKHYNLLSTNKSLWADGGYHGQLLIQGLDEIFFEQIVDAYKSKKYFFRKWTVYELDVKNGNDKNITISYSDGYLLVSSNGSYMIEEALSCLNGNDHCFYDMHTEINYLEEGELFMDLAFLSNSDISKLKAVNNLYSGKGMYKIRGVVQEKKSHFFSGKLITTEKYNTYENKEWQSMLSIIPDGIDYIGIHAYNKKAMNDTMLVGIDSDELNYATFLMPNELGQSDLFWVINTKKPAIQILNELEAKYGLLYENKNEVIPIKQIPITKLASRCSSIPFVPEIQHPYISAINDYLIFTSSKTAMDRYLNRYLINETLVNNNEFLQLLNKYDVSSISGSLHYFEDYIVRDKKGLIKINSQGKSPQIDVYLEDLKTKDKVVRSEWVYDFGENTYDKRLVIVDNDVYRFDLIKKVNDVKDAYDLNHKQLIMHQDSSNIIHWIELNGWLNKKIKLDGEIISRINHYKDETTQQDRYIFNTKNNIYLLDQDGENLHSFPIELSSPASNGIHVIQIPNSRSIYAFIACENGNYYGYDVNEGMKPMPSWNPLIGTGALKEEMTFLKGANEIHFVFLNKKRELISLDRKAQARFKPVKIEKEFLSKIQVDENIEGKERFVFHNGKGKLKIINTKGVAFNLQLGDEQEEGQFLLLNIMNDKQKEYLFLTKSYLYIYGYENNKFKLLSKIKNEYGIDGIFEVKGRHVKNKIGGINKSKNRIYLFNEKGILEEGFPLAGENPFKISYLNKDKYMLLTKMEGKMVSYVLTE